MLKLGKVVVSMVIGLLLGLVLLTSGAFAQSIGYRSVNTSAHPVLATGKLSRTIPNTGVQRTRALSFHQMPGDQTNLVNGPTNLVPGGQTSLLNPGPTSLLNPGPTSLLNPVHIYRPWYPVHVYRPWYPVHVYRPWYPVHVYRPWYPVHVYRPWYPVHVYRPWYPVHVYRPWHPVRTYIPSARLRVQHYYQSMLSGW